MRFRRQEISQYILCDTQVEDLFLAEFMPKAPGDCVKVYLLALMYVQLGKELETGELARATGISAEKVLECWDYWEAQGAVRKIYTKESGSYGYDIEFLSLREQALGLRPAPEKEEPVSIVDQNALSALYSDVESSTGRLLEPREITEISSWIADYGMSPSLILLGYDYCTRFRKSNRYSYVGAVLKDWMAKGLKTEEQVREHLQDMDKHYELYRKVFRALGFSRSPGEEEKRRMNAWVDDMGFSTERILEACAKSSGISNPNINYVDSVLKAWYKEEKDPGEKSPEDLFARINAMYQQEREENIRKTEENRRRICARIPRMSDIQEELKDAGYKMAKANFSGASGRSVIAAQKARIEALNKEKADLLRQEGLSPQAMDPIYTCPYCKDTGELDDGSRCSCFGTKLALLRGLPQERK